jgi:AraC-like DNA-binding protein
MLTGENGDLNVAAVYRFNGFRSRDPVETCRHTSAMLKDHALATFSDGFDADIHWAPAGGIALAILEYGAAVEIDPGSLHDFLLVQMPLAGRARVRRGCGELILSPETAGVIAPTMPFRIFWERDCRQLIVKIDRRKLEHVCQAHIARSLRAPVEFQADMPWASARGRGWRQLMAYALSILDQGTVSALAWAPFEEMVVTHLLLHQPNNYRDEIWADSREKPALPRCVRRAEAYIEAHAQEAIALADIAADAGVSVRTLCQSFRSFRNSSPMSFLRDARLEGARKDLLAGGASVTNIAYRWGFNHLGRFSALYRKRYGEKPLDTLRR